MNKLLGGILLFMVPYCLSSCSVKLFSGKKHKHNDTTVATVKTDTALQAAPAVTAPKDTATTINTTNAISSATALLINDLLPMWHNRLSYKTFSGKAKISFDGPDGSKEFTAHFRIKKDSVIWVNITAAFVSFVRIYITPDSFFMVNYLQKEVTRIALKDAAKTLPTLVEFAQLQNLIVGEPLQGGTITDAATQPTTWAITVEDTNYLQHITYTKADSTIRTEQMATRKPDGPQVMIDYTNYELINSRKISTNRSIHTQNGDKSYTIDMNFINSEFDKELEYPFSIPKNYSLKNPQ